MPLAMPPPTILITNDMGDFASICEVANGYCKSKLHIRLLCFPVLAADIMQCRQGFRHESGPSNGQGSLLSGQPVQANVDRPGRVFLDPPADQRLLSVWAQVTGERVLLYGVGR